MLDESAARRLIEATRSGQPASDLTHGFYAYPARFSPLFARAAIEAFTAPGDFVVDPFVGGGTTLVEARALGRRSLGVDVNQLGIFVSQVKTTVLSDADIKGIRRWAAAVEEERALKLNKRARRHQEWIDRGYQRNINDAATWRVRKLLELALEQVGRVPRHRQRRFVRCVLLKTGQWALDCRRTIPRVGDVRDQFLKNVEQMSEAARDFSARVREAAALPGGRPLAPVLVNGSAVGIHTHPRITTSPVPRLVLTSPPYPGVHMLYHRWQVRGRRETPAPFWIADRVDGRGASFYTSGSRERYGIDKYYEAMRGAFVSLSRLADESTMVVQMIAFSDPGWQLPRYLQLMEEAGFRELVLPEPIDSKDGRLWRRVPHRKWYADKKGAIPSSREVVLFHALG